MISNKIWFLVDYDNLHSLDSKRGITYVVGLLLERLGESRLKCNDRAHIRLYGGWYEEDSLTRLAQKTVADIDKNFPRIIQIKEAKVKVTAELARSLVASPKDDLLHTFRPRQFPGNVRCMDPPFDGCIDHKHCPINSVGKFVNNGKCISKGCYVRPRQIFSKPTQKLVDSMIVADVISLASGGYKCAVVSSDDDVWPGIRTAVEFGKPVYHLHCKPNRSTSRHYTRDLSPNYVQILYKT